MDEVKNKALFKYRFIYSPRTTYNKQILEEDKLYKGLFSAIDPYSIKIIKKHFKERLGNLKKDTFIAILKRHLLTWNYSLKNRDEILIKLLSRFFDEIDVDSKGILNWNDFINYTINEMSLSYDISKDIKGSLYSIQKYKLCQKKLYTQEVRNNNYNSSLNIEGNVYYSFYIEKYKLLGIVHDGQSKINFYNMETFTKSHCEINLIQIDDKVKKLMMKKLLKKVKIKSDKNNSNNNRINTPDSLRKEITKINKEKKHNKKKIIKNILKNEVGFFALCAVFVEENDLLFISSSNKIISTWQYNQEKNEFININYDEKEKKEIKSDLNVPLYISELSQYCMCFDIETNSLFTGQEDGKIFKWNMEEKKPVAVLEISNIKNNEIRKVTDDSKRSVSLKYIRDKKTEYVQKKLKESKQILANLNKTIGNIQNEMKEFKKNIKLIKEDYNRETVSCILLISKLRLLCSGHYNGYIILWDLLKNLPKVIYNDQQTGIYQLEYNENKNHIYSCGFDHDIHVYDPYHEKNFIYKFKGHIASVNSISFNSTSNELISIDILGNIIIWNADTFSPYQLINRIQTFEIEPQKLNKKEVLLRKIRSSNTFVKSLQNINKFIIYGEKFLIYEKDQVSNPSLCDDYIILGCRYNKKTNDIITFSFKRVKFWNIFTGKIHKIYDNLMEDYGITAFEVDKNGKKIYLGSILGKIKCFNISNGNLIRKYKSHKKEITHIIQSIKYNLLITASEDLRIIFHLDRDEEHRNNIIKEMSLGNNLSKNKISIKNMILDENSNMLIIALSDGTITFFDMIHFKCIDDYNNPRPNIEKELDVIIKLSNMINIEGSDCLFIGYDNGENFIMANQNNKYYSHLPVNKFGCFENKGKNNLNVKNIILKSDYDKISHKLLLGNQIGTVICYDLSPLVKIMNTDYNSIDSAIKNITKNLYFSVIYKIEAHKESITFINIPYGLEPRIFFCSSTDRTVKLYDLENGNFIDSLKQYSFKNESLPIAIKYIKDNPFLEMKNEEKIYKELYKDNNEELKINLNNKKGNKKNNNESHLTLNINNGLDENVDNKLNIIYKGLLEPKIKKPIIDYNNSCKEELIQYTDQLIEYNAKTMLKNKYIDSEYKHNHLKRN